MMRVAIVNTTTKIVELVLIYSDDDPVEPPHDLGAKYIALQSDLANVGWLYNTGVLSAPPSISFPNTTVLPQDLIAQLTTSDAEKIQTTIAGNTQLWLLWQSLTAQKDPMLVSNSRFQAGWSALESVLGQDRMNTIAIALGVMVV